MNDEAFQNLEKLVGKITNEHGVSFCTDGILCSSGGQTNTVVTVALRHVAYVSCCDSTVEVHFTGPIPHQRMIYDTPERALTVFKDISVNLSNTFV